MLDVYKCFMNFEDYMCDCCTHQLLLSRTLSHWSFTLHDGLQNFDVFVECIGS